MIHAHTPIFSHSRKTRYRTLEGLEALEAFLCSCRPQAGSDNTRRRRFRRNVWEPSAALAARDAAMPFSRQPFLLQRHSAACSPVAAVYDRRACCSRARRARVVHSACPCFPGRDTSPRFTRRGGRQLRAVPIFPVAAGFSLRWPARDSSPRFTWPRSGAPRRRLSSFTSGAPLCGVPVCAPRIAFGAPRFALSFDP